MIKRNIKIRPKVDIYGYSNAGKLLILCGRYYKPFNCNVGT